MQDPFYPQKYATFHHDLDYNPLTRTFLGLYKYLHRNASGSDDRAVYDAFYEVSLPCAALNSTQHNAVHDSAAQHSTTHPAPHRTTPPHPTPHHTTPAAGTQGLCLA